MSEPRISCQCRSAYVLNIVSSGSAGPRHLSEASKFCLPEVRSQRTFRPHRQILSDEVGAADRSRSSTELHPTQTYGASELEKDAFLHRLILVMERSLTNSKQTLSEPRPE